MRTCVLLAPLCFVVCACGSKQTVQRQPDASDYASDGYLAIRAGDLEAIAIDRALPYFPFWTNDGVTLGLRAAVGNDGALHLTRRGYPVPILRDSSLDIEADATAWALLRSMGGFDSAKRISAGCTEGSAEDMILWLAQRPHLRSITIAMHRFDTVSLAPIRTLRGPINLELHSYYNQSERSLPRALLDQLQHLDNVDSIELRGTIDDDAHTGLINLLGKRRLFRFVILESAIDDPALVIAALSGPSIVWLRVTQACLEAVAGNLTPDQTFGVEGLYLEVPVGARDAAMEITRRCPRLFDLSFKWTRP